jgi:hypothetical protein
LGSRTSASFEERRESGEHDVAPLALLRLRIRGQLRGGQSAAGFGELEHFRPTATEEPGSAQAELPPTSPADWSFASRRGDLSAALPREQATR